MTSIIFVTGLSGIKVQFGSIQLTGMVLACVVGDHGIDVLPLR